MLKMISLALAVCGVILLSIGGCQYFESKAEQKVSLSKAQRAIEQTELKSPFSPKLGEEVGILEIPNISAKLPIIEGTDEDELEKGVGHFKGSAFPLQNDQIVLSGHRDTVFRKVGALKIGDKFIVILPYGEFTYVIENTKIVEADDRTVIKSTSPNEILTVTTCYPFSYIGDAPQRYIITAIPKENK